ncbi:MAG: S8 family serine peptidase [Blastocatellia bacterium]
MSDLRKVSNNLSKMIGAEAGEIIGKLPEILNEEQQKAVVQDVNELVVRAFAGSDVEIKPLAASARVGALDRLTIAIARYDHSASKALLPIREAAKPEWRIADFLCGEEEKIDQALNWLINQRGTCEQNLVYLNLLLKHKYNPQYAKANLPMKIELAENTIRMQLFRQMGGYRLYRSSNDAQPLPPEVVLIQELAAFSIVSAPESLVSILWGYRAEPLQPAVPAKLPSSTPIRERKSMPMPMRDYIVRFLPSKRNLVKKQLEEAGATILQPLGGTDYPDYIVAIPSKEAMESIEDLPGKLWIEPYQPSIRLNLSRYQSPSNQPLETAESLTTERDEQKVIPHAFYASFFTPQDRDLAAAVWRTQGIEIVETVGKKDLIVSISGVVNPEQALDLLIRQVGLRYLEEELKVSLLGNVACRVIGVPPSSVGEASLNLTGKAEILAIADSGLDNGDINTLHPDFRGRVKAIQPYRPGLPVADESGHGTHVAGIAIGNGTQASSMNLTIKGVAPEAELFFQAGVTSVDHLLTPLLTCSRLPRARCACPFEFLGS